jgi:ArsR family transcriptional regulator
MRMNDQAVDALDESVEVFKALADPVRLRLLNLIGEGEVCVCHLYEAMDLPQSTVSRHLGYLRKRGLVIGRKEGLWVYYRLAKPAGEVHRKAMDCARLCGTRSDQLKADRERLKVRSCCGE